MAIYKEDLVSIELETGSIHRSFLSHTIGSGDSLANRYGVRLFRNGEPVSAEASTVTAIFRAPDGGKYAISETSYPGSTGTDGNAAWVQLPPVCYAVTGQFCLAIKLSGGSVEGTMRIVDGIVSDTGEAGAVVPTSTIPTTEEIIAAYEEAVAVIAGSVRFDAEQTLSETEKATARDNIGAIEDHGIVRFDAEQTLSDAEKATARDNIGAMDAQAIQDISDLQIVTNNISNHQANKQTKYANYIRANGAVNSNDLSVNTEDTKYGHYEMPISNETMLFVCGYSYGSNYAGWIIVDTNDVIIAKRNHGDSETGYSFSESVSIPPEAAKFIVNIYYTQESFIYEYSEQPSITEDIRTKTVPIGGKYVFDHSYSLENGSVSTDHLFCEYDISEEGTYYISGANISKNYPLYVLLDNNGNILNVFGQGGNKIYKDYKVAIPSNAKKLIVNTIVNTVMPKVKKYVEGSSLADVIGKDVRDNEFDLISLYPEIAYGSVVKRDLSIVDTNENYMHIVFGVEGGKTYYITGRNYSVNYPMVMFTDSNDELIYSSGWELTQNTPYFNYKVIAPLNAENIIINSIKGEDIDIKVNGTGTLYNTLNQSQITGIYLGKTPIKEAEYDYSDGSWTYNAQRAYRNLSKFGYAYATMLDRIMKTYPNAIVVCCNLNETERTTSELGFPERNSAGETIADYNHVIEEMAKAFGAILVDHHSCGITLYNLESYMYDYSSSTGFGLHPNAAGMEMIAQKTIKDLSGLSWTGKKVSVFGDSISTYAGTGSSPNQYPAGDVTSVDKTWWHISLIAGLGMTLHTNGSGGGRTVSTIREGIENRPKSGCNQDAINALAVNGVAPDVIVIKQGINDYGNVGSTGNRDLGQRYYYGGL